MTISEILGFAITTITMAFGFGRQSAELRTLRRDTDNIGKGYREIIAELQEINKKLERLDQRVIYCEKE